MNFGKDNLLIFSLFVCEGWCCFFSLDNLTTYCFCANEEELLLKLLIASGAENISQNLDDFVNTNYYNMDGLSFCAVCDYSNVKSTNVKTHIETHHAPEILKRLPCQYCGYVCPSRSALRMHLKKKHNQ